MCAPRESMGEKGKKTRDFIQKFLRQEVNVIEKTINTRNTLDVQMKYRMQVAANLKELKARAQENPSEYLTREISDLEEHLSLCTEMISQMQREIVAGDKEDMVKSMFENIHTVEEAKLLVQQIFETMVEICREQKAETVKVREAEAQLSKTVSIDEHRAVMEELREKKAQLTKTVGIDEHRAVMDELEM